MKKRNEIEEKEGVEGKEVEWSRSKTGTELKIRKGVADKKESKKLRRRAEDQAIGMKEEKMKKMEQKERKGKKRKEKERKGRERKGKKKISKGSRR